MSDYTPGLVPQDPKDIPAYLERELQELSDVLRESPSRNVEFRNVAPTKPREGNLYGADGVNWNPGAGKGVYCYYTGAWHFLG